MADLKNTNRLLIEGVVRILREEVDGWSIDEEYEIENVWGRNVPKSSEKEYPRGVVDIISGNDFELDVDLDISLSEVTLKVVVFSDSAGEVENLIDETEEVMKESWDSVNSDGEPFLGDWSFREVDGFTELNETGEIDNDLLYSRSVDMIFEVIK